MERQVTPFGLDIPLDQRTPPTNDPGKTPPTSKTKKKPRSPPRNGVRSLKRKRCLDMSNCNIPNNNLFGDRTNLPTPEKSSKRIMTKQNSLFDDNSCTDAPVVHTEPERISNDDFLSLIKSMTPGSHFMRTYRKEEQVGCGSFGSVYKCSHLQDGKQYAIKEIEMPNIKKIRPRYLREVNSHSKMDHPNIVRYYDSWVEDTTDGIALFIKLEYCEGGTLQSAIASHTKFENRQLLNILQNIAKGLQHIHSKGVLHLDIKPSNILFVDASRKVVKIGDFGLARIVGKDGVQMEKTHGSEGDGKYLAPEVFNDDISEATDIFALGMTMFELITAKELPATHTEEFANIRKGLNLEKVASGFPASTRLLIEDMVSKKKKSRPTATEIVDRTQKLLFPPIYRASSNFGARSLRAYGSTPNSIGAGYLSWSPQTTRVKKQTDVEKKKGKEMEVNEKRDA